MESLRDRGLRGGDGWLGRPPPLLGGPVSALNGFLYADALSALVVGLTAFVALVAPDLPSFAPVSDFLDHR